LGQPTQSIGGINRNRLPEDKRMYVYNNNYNDLKGSYKYILIDRRDKYR